jgi:hypothetical protein
MDSFTLCWKNKKMFEIAGVTQSKSLRWLAGFVFLVCQWMVLPATAQIAVQFSEPLIERGDDGIYVNGNLEFELSAGLEDALTRGMPLTFVLQAEVMRERWYWYDKSISLTERYYRLTYQPLSRRWRLHASSTPVVNTGLGVTLGNSYDSLRDAMQAMQKISRWRVADLGILQKDVRQRLDLRFRLDLSQLPQALQFGNQSSNDWNVNYTHSFRLEDLNK